MTRQEMELAGKYHWRIKYPKTFEMAVRNGTLDAVPPAATVAPVTVPQSDLSDMVSPLPLQKRQRHDFPSEPDTLESLSAPGPARRRRGRRNGQTEFRKRAAPGDDPDTRELLAEILDRLTWLEEALSTPPEP